MKKKNFDHLRQTLEEIKDHVWEVLYKSSDRTLPGREARLEELVFYEKIIKEITKVLKEEK